MVEHSLGLPQTRPLPQCPPFTPATHTPLNISSKTANIHVGLKLLSKPEIFPPGISNPGFPPFDPDTERMPPDSGGSHRLVVWVVVWCGCVVAVVAVCLHHGGGRRKRRWFWRLVKYVRKAVVNMFQENPL